MSQLSGSLQTFRVQEILALIARKPGYWRLDLQAEHGAFVGIHQGAVVSVSANTSRQDFARRLVIEGAVGTTSLASALRTAGEEGVVGCLLDADLIDPDVLPRLAQEHLVSALADLTHWRAGTFHASVTDSLPDDVGVSLPLSTLGAQITELLRKWRAASDHLGGAGTVVSALPGTVPDHLRGLHALIDGRRTVAELVEASGHGEVGTVVDLGDLVAAGCASPVTAGAPAVEQQLQMLSVLEDAVPTPTRPHGVHLAVIQGAASADDEKEAAPAQDNEQDLLTVILRGVRGV